MSLRRELKTENNYFLSTIKVSQLAFPVFSNECDATAGRKVTSPRFCPRLCIFRPGYGFDSYNP